VSVGSDSLDRMVLRSRVSEARALEVEGRIPGRAPARWCGGDAVRLGGLGGGLRPWGRGSAEGTERASAADRMWVGRREGSGAETCSDHHGGSSGCSVGEDSGESGSDWMQRSDARQRMGTVSRESRRTPWPVAGCNRPARRCVEQAVEVGRNDKDGTCTRCGDLVPKEAERFLGTVSWRVRLSRAPRPGVDTHAGIGGGAIYGNPKRGVRSA
jgi:hypothetical protein